MADVGLNDEAEHNEGADHSLSENQDQLLPTAGFARSIVLHNAHLRGIPKCGHLPAPPTPPAGVAAIRAGWVKRPCT